MAEPNPLDTTEHDIKPVAQGASTEPVAVEFAALTNPGRVRLTNEDHFLVTRLSRTLEILDSSLPAGDVPKVAELDAFIFAVADGVGGHVAGERASRLVLGQGIQLILTSVNWALLLDDGESQRLRTRIVEYFASMNEQIRLAVEADPELDGMATTLCVVYTVGLRAFVVHVGDSRVYLQRRGALTQLTVDHTLAQRLVETGVIDRDEAHHHPRKHVLTKVLAGRDDIGGPEVSEHHLQDGDVIMLCSDGLSDLIAADQINAILTANPSSAAAAKALIDAALHAGGRDNVTVVVARFSQSATSP